MGARGSGWWCAWAAALVLVGLALSARGADAQELEPRSYANAPVGMNFLVAGYGYTRGSLVFSATTPLADAEVETHAAFLAYARVLDVWGRSGKLTLVLPAAAASGSATLAGEEREREVSGLADPRVRFSVNLYGAPALSMEEFQHYQPDLIVGVSLDVAPPLGQYDPDKLLNLGTNRWLVKPELGASKTLGPFTLEASAAVTFFTPNNDFLGGKTLEQSPLFSAQAHVIYQFRSGIWAALNGTYYAGGRPTIDGDRGDTLEHARLGLTISIPVNRHNSIKLHGSTGVYSRSGANFDALGIAWQVRWGGGL